MKQNVENELDNFIQELDEFHNAFVGLVEKGILVAVGMNEEGEVQYRLDEKGIEIAKQLGFEEAETTQE